MAVLDFFQHGDRDGRGITNTVKKFVANLAEWSLINNIVTLGLAFHQSQTAGHPTTGKMHNRQGMYMIRLVNLIFFLGCALAVAHYYGLGSTLELLAAVAVGLMRLLSNRRVH
jgi:hypothetical protein